MQNPTTTLHNPMMMDMKHLQQQQQQPQLFPEQEIQQQQLKCPRCDSSNTKLCYYNNYNLSQPRHFCKNCRRYWTKGGALRNIPIGGGTRKSTTKRSSPSSPSSSSTPSKKSNLSSKLPSPPPVSAQPDPNLKDPDPGFPDPTRFDGKGVALGGNGSGSFSSLLASTVQWGGLWEGSGLRMMRMNSNGFGENNVVRNMDSGIGNGNSEGILGNKQNVDSSCWNNGDNGGGTNGWSDLAIYTPGSSYE